MNEVLLTTSLITEEAISKFELGIVEEEYTGDPTKATKSNLCRNIKFFFSHFVHFLVIVK